VNQKIIVTYDNSYTISLSDNLSYRSKYGAKTESIAVFLNASGIHDNLANNWQVAELGLGTAMNFFETYIYALDNGLKLDYLVFENNPLNAEKFIEILTLNKYSTVSNFNEICDFYRNVVINTSNSSLKIFSLPNLNLFINIIDWNTDAQELFANLGLGGENYFDSFYFDPFAPSFCNKIWSTQSFSKAYYLLKEGGKLVTYSSAGAVRRSLESVGFKVRKLRGPNGKREIVMAEKGIKLLYSRSAIK
jgi:tRNA U34 5-methylaminomethyl-2-thiouridine-forming methyltransferase MnmC